jgi:hypothetical protein
MELTATLVLAKTKVDNLALVKNLNLWGSDLENVAVIRQLPNLEVLALSVNRITSLADMTYCTALRELYLRKNNISNLGEVKHLSNLPHLTVLWLCDNPCSSHPLYRIFTIRCCSALKQFDNVEVSPQERAQADRLTQNEIDDILGQRGRYAANKEAPPPPPPVPSAGGADNSGKRSSTSDNSSNAGSGKNQGDPTSSSSQPATAEKRGPMVPPPVQQPPQQQAASARPSHSNRQTQKNVLSAVLTLLNEMNVDTLQYLHTEVGEQLQRKRAGQ